MSELLLRDALLPGAAAGSLSDVLVRDGLIAAVAPAGTLAGAESTRLDGRWLRPGLWDEHVHFTQWVKQRGRLDLSHTRSAAEVLDAIRTADTEFVIGYGFRDALWPDQPTLAAIDALFPSRPAFLISGDLHCGWLNSAAAARLGVTVEESGLLREAAWLETLARLDEQTGPDVAAYRAAADEAARRGVVGIVDFEYADNVHLWPSRVSQGVTALRVEASIWPDGLPAAIEAGYRTGQPLGDSGLVTVGRLKVVVDGSLNTRTALCWDPYPDLASDAPHRCGVQTFSPSQLGELLESAHRNGIAPAIHAIGDRANTQVIDEFERLGIPGVIEHAQLVSTRDFPRFGALGLVASVQPEHAMDDRDVADHHWAGRTDRAFAFASLHAAGATLRLGSDAPVSPLDPWLALSAAVSRSRDGRTPWHPEQRLPREVALAAGARGRLDVAVGDLADLIVLDEDPLTATPERLRTMPVAATFLAGRPTHDTLT